MSNVPPVSDREQRIRTVVVQFRKALARGEAIDIEAVAARHADLADDLRTILRAIVATEGDLGAADEVPQDAGRSPGLGEGLQEAPPAPQEDGETQYWAGEEAGSSTDDATRSLPPSGSSVPAGESVRSQGLPPGTQIGGFEIVSPIGRGGMGDVYVARERESQRMFALKLLSTTLPRSTATVDRFLNEATLAARLSHPRTTFVYGAGREADQFYITMELMPGHTLKDLVETDGPMPVRAAVDHALDILDGLDAAHSIGVIHRDLKPSNCFLDRDGRVKVGDFGLAKSLVANVDITQTGSFLGTPQFAAPEQIRRDNVDRRTDIFALGATLYFLLTGEAPFSGDPAAVIAKIVADPPEPIRKRRPEIPRSLSRIIHRCLAKNPSQRFSSVAELRRALRPFSTDGVSLSDVGRRIAAFALDLFVVSSLTVLVYLAFFGVWMTLKITESPVLLKPVLGFFANVSIVTILYYAITESFLGNSVGKHWLKLRVVDNYGESPNFLRCLWRAILFPGVFFTTVDVTQSLVTGWEPFQEWVRVALPIRLLREFVISEGFLFVKVALAAVCFSTMRRASGYRGLHEIWSGTRVVGLRPGGRKGLFRELASWGPDISPAKGLPQQLGGYTVEGALGASTRRLFLLARDSTLGRSVWMTVGTAFDFAGDRAQVNRVTRQRWLEKGSDGERQWQVMEAIDGGPLWKLVRPEGSFPWQAGARVLPALAEELLASVDDETLPERLTFDQLWLDRDGGLRLLDGPLRDDAEGRDHVTEGGQVTSSAERRDAAVSRAWSFLRDVARRCQADLAVPGAVLDELERLPQLPATREQLAATAERVREWSRVPYRLEWDNRLGVVAVAMFIEMSFLLTWTFVTIWYLASVMDYRFGPTVAVSLPVAMILPAVWGFVSRGGLAFSLSEMETRAIGSRKPSRWRSAVRAVLAWLPFATPIVIFRVLMFAFSPLATVDAGRNAATGITLAVVAGMVATFVGGIAVLTTVYSVWSPRRGLQDRLAGTYVVRR